LHRDRIGRGRPSFYDRIERTCRPAHGDDSSGSKVPVDFRVADSFTLFGGSVQELRACVSNNSHAKCRTVGYNEGAEVRRAMWIAVVTGTNQCIMEYPDDQVPSDGAVNCLSRLGMRPRRELLRSVYCRCGDTNGCRCSQRRRRVRLIFDLLPPVYPLSPVSSGSRVG
jgi:hypothetical protein